MLPRQCSRHDRRRTDKRVNWSSRCCLTSGTVPVIHVGFLPAAFGDAESEDLRGVFLGLAGEVEDPGQLGDWGFAGGG